MGLLLNRFSVIGSFILGIGQVMSASGFLATHPEYPEWNILLTLTVIAGIICGLFGFGMADNRAMKKCWLPGVACSFLPLVCGALGNNFLLKLGILELIVGLSAAYLVANLVKHKR